MLLFFMKYFLRGYSPTLSATATPPVCRQDSRSGLTASLHSSRGITKGQVKTGPTPSLMQQTWTGTRVQAVIVQYYHS
jgi:hypothetical protein